MMMIEFRVLRSEDEAVLDQIAEEVFDAPIHPRAAREFLADPRHHLVVALAEGVVIGFVSAVHYIHPDKPGPEMWVNEVGVSSKYRNQGVGKGMMKTLVDLARELGCREAWVLTERENIPAMRLYRSAGGVEAEDDTVMFTFFVDPISPG
jgi:GNAT superfamily N-acetyltransferase